MNQTKLTVNNSTPNSSSAWVESVQLLKSKRFGTFWFANFLSNIGTWSQQVAQPWVLLSLGAPPLILGLDALALGAPVLLLTLLGGLLADKADRRKVIAICQLIQMLCPIILVLMLFLQLISPWMIVCLSLIIGVTDALSMPYFQTILSSIVSKDQIPSALALNSTQFNLTRIIGPAIAGILLVSVGAIGCFAISATSYIPFIFVALWILPTHIPKPRDIHNRHQTISTGVTEIIKIPYLRGGLVTALLSSFLCGPLVTFSSVLVKNVFFGNALEFSVAMSSFGIGALLGAICLVFLNPKLDRRLIASSLAIFLGLSLILVGLNPWNQLFPILMIFAGFSMIVTNISVNTLIQTHAPDLLRGQAISLFMLASRGGVAMGAFVTGGSIHLVGIRNTLIINGSIAILLQTIVFLNWIKKRQVLI